MCLCVSMCVCVCERERGEGVIVVYLFLLLLLLKFVAQIVSPVSSPAALCRTRPSHTQTHTQTHTHTHTDTHTHTHILSPFCLFPMPKGAVQLTQVNIQNTIQKKREIDGWKESKNERGRASRPGARKQTSEQKMKGQASKQTTQ